MKKYFFGLIFVLFFPALIFGEADYSQYPGYFDFGDMTGFKEAEKSVEVYISEPLLSLVAALNQEDPDLNELISKLVLIRVEQFSIEPEKREDIDNTIETFSKQLRKRKWDKMVSVKDHDERIEIFLKTDGEKISGLLVMALEGNGEAAFINIVGELDLKLLGKLGAKFNIPALKTIPVASQEIGNAKN